MQFEKQEYLAELALKEDLLRQEKLEQLACKFERKSLLREGYLNEMIAVQSNSRYGSNLQHVGASVKKHEAISTDILSRQERFKDLKAMSVSSSRRGTGWSRSLSWRGGISCCSCWVFTRTN